MTEQFTSLESTVDRIVAATGGRLVLAAPLGIGKPHRLINALYARVASDPVLSG